MHLILTVRSFTPEGEEKELERWRAEEATVSEELQTESEEAQKHEQLSGDY